MQTLIAALLSSALITSGGPYVPETKTDAPVRIQERKLTIEDFPLAFEVSTNLETGESTFTEKEITFIENQMRFALKKLRAVQPLQPPHPEQLPLFVSLKVMKRDGSSPASQLDQITDINLTFPFRFQFNTTIFKSVFFDEHGKPWPDVETQTLSTLAFVLVGHVNFYVGLQRNYIVNYPQFKTDSERHSTFGGWYRGQEKTIRQLSIGYSLGAVTTYLESVLSFEKALDLTDETQESRIRRDLEERLDLLRIQYETWKKENPEALEN